MRGAGCQRGGCGNQLLRSLLISTILTGSLPPFLLTPAIAGTTPPATTIITPGGTNAPTMSVAPNATKIVTINTPNGAGVSNNTYTNFNVGADGVILNNSNAIVSTKLGGYIDGNGNLAGSGPARLILNQVISSDPTTLAGYTEVAGTPAQVVVANPNGITCSGCGFINSPWATLTTGTATFGANGAITGYGVDGGAIAITGNGLNATGMRLDLFTRALTLNAGIWADSIHASVGAANVAVTPNQGDAIVVTARSPTSPAPAFGLDVAALGGMYANSIRLIGTEAGLGVRVNGTLASLENGVSLSNAGDVAVGNTGQIVGATNVGVQTGGQFNNSGAIYGATGTGITTGGTLTNNGLLASGSDLALNIGALSSTGTLAAGMSQAGTLSQSGGITIATTGTGTGAVALNGQTAATGDISVSAANIDLSGGTTPSTIQGANVTLTTPGAITNTGGQLYASGALAISSGSLSNQGLIEGKDVTVNTGAADNSKGQIFASGALDVSAASLLNTGGTLSGVNGLTLTTGTLNNDGGTLFAGQVAQAATSTTAAVPAVASNLIINAGSVSNAPVGTNTSANGGAIEATGGVAFHVGSLTGAGTIVAQTGDITGTATTSILTHAGTYQAGGNINLAAGDTINLAPPAASSGGTGGSGSGSTGSGGSSGSSGSGTGGSGSGSGSGSSGGTGSGTGTTATSIAQVNAGNTLTLTAPTLILDGASLQAGASTTLNAPTMSSVGTLFTQSGTGAFALSGNAGLKLAGASVITSGAGLAITAPSLDLQGGTISYGGTGQLAINVTGLLDASQKGGVVSGGTLDLTIGSLDTSSGGGLSGAQGLTITSAGVVNNAGGSLISGGTLGLTGTALTNSGGVISAFNGLTITGSSLDNSLSSGGVAGQINDAGGAVYNATTQTWSNAAPALGTQITIAGAIAGRGGMIGGNGAVTINAGSLDVGGANGIGGSLTAGTDLGVTTTGANGTSGAILADTGGFIAAGGNLTLTAAGVIDAHGSLAGGISHGAVVAANGGTISAGGTVGLNATSLNLTDANAYGSSFTLNAPSMALTGAVIQQAGTSDFAMGAGTGALNLSGATLLTNGINATFTASSLDAQSVTIEHSGSGALTFNVSGLLDASNNALVATAGHLQANVGSLTTAMGGALSGALGLNVTSTGAVNNAGGSLVSGGVLGLSGTTLTNTGGTISATNGLNVTGTSLDNSSGGQLVQVPARPALPSPARSRAAAVRWAAMAA